MLVFLRRSESMGNHDSEIVDADAHIIAWWFWRSAHQDAAQRAHLKKRQL
jgi:hypothetical protein